MHLIPYILERWNAVARKASPDVQYKLMEVAMGRLEPEQRIVWAQNFLKQAGIEEDKDPIKTAIERLSPKERLYWISKYLDEFDNKSLLIAGIMDCLDIYIEDNFAPKVCNVDGSDLTEKELMEMVAGYGKPKNATEAVEMLREQGFKVVVL